jgi:hypothetical protein
MWNQWGGKSVSRHNHHSALQRAKLWWVYRDTGMMETVLAMGVDGYTGVMEMDGVTGSIYSGDFRIDRLLYLISYHLIIQGITHSIFPNI